MTLRIAPRPPQQPNPRPFPRRDPRAVRLFVEDAGETMERELVAVAAEARHTAIVMALSLAAALAVTWLYDLATGGPGLGTMVGL